MSRPRVLHIEDDPANRLLVKKLLEAAGYEVVEAVDGRQAVSEALTHGRPDLVLVDINVPGLDGYEVTLRLRGMPELASVPIVALTAEGDRDMSLAVGCDGFIQKPIDVRSFVRTVSRYLEGQRDQAGHTQEDTGRYLRQQGHKIVQRLEQKIAELEAANVQLREMDRLRKEFYQNVSHELSTPMTPLLGYLRLLLGEELGPLTPRQSKVLAAMESCTSRLRSLIDNLLDVTAIETGRMHLEERDYDLGAVARGALEARRRAFDDKGILLTQSLPVAPVPVRGDAEKVARAMGAILDNAAKFTPPNGRVQVTVTPEPEGAVFEVVDSGEGIPEAARAHVFDPFYQVDGSPTRAHEGVGLGLALAKRIVEMMGGAIWVESPPSFGVAPRATPPPAPGRGTRVSIRVPRVMRRSVLGVAPPGALR